MATDLPMACSLSAAELPERLADLRRVGSASLRSVTRDGGRAELRFGAEARDRVAELVAAERECCGFMDFALEQGDGEVVLRVGAPAGAEPVLEGLVAAFGDTGALT